MDISKLTERFMGMDDATWAKHANPWSGWSRMPILPLLSLAIWSRVWLGWGALWLVLAVLVWTWLNPRLFSVPSNHNAWMTKAVLGERVWLASGTNPIPYHHARVSRVLNIAAVIGSSSLHTDFGNLIWDGRLPVLSRRWVQSFGFLIAWSGCWRI